MPRLCLTFAVVVTFALSFGETASAKKANNTTAQYQKALAIAQASVPDAQLGKSRLERNGAQYGFYFWKEGKLYEIEIDATSFKILKQVTQTDANKVSADVVKLIGQQKAAKTKLPEGRLLEIAADSLKNTGVSEVKYSIVDGKLVLQVGDLLLDAATGKPVTK